MYVENHFHYFSGVVDCGVWWIEIVYFEYNWTFEVEYLTDF